MEFYPDISILSILVRLGTAVIIIIIGRRLAISAQVWTRKALVRAEMTESLISLFTMLSFYGILLLTLILALTILGIPMGTIIGAAGIIAIILGIALRESLANFAATILFLIFQPYKEGDLVETAGVIGVVKEIQLFYSVIITFQKKMVTIPNGKVQDSNIVNYSRLGVLRADVDVSVSYEDDLPKVKRLLQTMLAEDERVLPEPEATVVILDFGDNGIGIGVRPFVKLDDYWTIQFDLRERIKEAFDENGITIPYPQRDVHMVTAT